MARIFDDWATPILLVEREFRRRPLARYERLCDIGKCDNGGISSLKGWNKLAQGNALSSVGRSEQALKGRNKPGAAFCSALTGRQRGDDAELKSNQRESSRCGSLARSSTTRTSTASPTSAPRSR